MSFPVSEQKWDTDWPNPMAGLETECPHLDPGDRYCLTFLYRHVQLLYLLSKSKIITANVTKVHVEGAWMEPNAHASVYFSNGSQLGDCAGLELALESGKFWNKNIKFMTLSEKDLERIVSSQWHVCDNYEV